jgi:hypothetical protein
MNEMYNSLDPETSDVPDVIRAMNETAAKVECIQRNTADVRGYLEGVHAQDRQIQQETTRRAIEEEICSACDADYGAEHRAEAIRLANEKVDRGELPRPTTPTAGLTLMQKCHAEVVARTKTPARPRELNPVTVRGTEEFKPGTLDEVAADLRRKMANGKWKRAFRDPGV